MFYFLSIKDVRMKIQGKFIVIVMLFAGGLNILEDNKTHESSNIIIFPDFEKLKAEVEKLRIELSMLVLEKDELLFVECKNIEMAYMLAVGGLEYKAYETECSVLRLKRKLDLIQAKKNRQEKIVLQKIEEILDFEFEEYQAKLNEQIEKMNEALNRSNSTALSEDENSELKKLYREIVKALHPDLNPGLSNEKIKLFHNALLAYKNGDLTGLRIISAMVSQPVLPEKSTDVISWFDKEKERLCDMVKKTNEIIEKIKSEYPYTMKALISNTEKIDELRDELEEKIDKLKELYDFYNLKIEEMLKVK